MKIRVLFLVIVVGVILILISQCGEKPKVDNELAKKLELQLDSIKVEEEIVQPEVEIPFNEEREKVEKELIDSSPFSSLGCCSEDVKNPKPCCCDAVIEEYKDLLSNEDPNLGEYLMTDPILNKCKKLNRKKFNLIDAKVEELKNQITDDAVSDRSTETIDVSIDDDDGW